MEVYDVCESGYALVCRQAPLSAIDDVSIGDYVVAASEVTSMEVASYLLSVRKRAGKFDAIEAAKQMRAHARGQGRDGGMAFEVWHIVEDPSHSSMQVFADYAEIEDGRITYMSGRFQDVETARIYVRDKWHQFVGAFDARIQDRSHLGSHGAYLDAFSVRVVQETTYPVG